MPAAVPFSEALKFWLKLGCISFGGPAGQIAVMHRELVDERRWISERRFLHALNYCMVLPGPEAQQLATYIGWLMHRTWGGIVAGALFVLPSLLILILLSWVYIAYGHLHWVEGLFYGIKPAVTAIVIQAAHRIGSRVLKNAWLWTIAVAALAAIALLKVPFPLIVLAAALAGLLGSWLAPDKFRVGAGHSAMHAAHAAAIIDDHTPVPEHAQFRWQRLLRITVVGVLLWAASMALLVVQFGRDHLLTQMGWFFTKAAWLTFGGAYAVLPYVYQGAVDQHAWLAPQQMIDGLALGETTPGPLIMVVAFVGFVGGYTKAWLGAQSLFLAGAVAAIVVTWFTFLPSFLLIFGGAPLVESTQHEVRVTAPLTAITAAVVGVIANLAIFFAWHVFWPNGLEGTVDWISIGLAVAAAVALLRFKQGVVPVILACGMAGLVLKTVT
jgi:chromate transporter